MKQELPITAEELKTKFYNLKTLDDLAELSDVPTSKLSGQSHLNLAKIRVKLAI